MLTIIHGDDTASSRNKLIDIISAKQFLRLNNPVSYDSFIQATRTSDMFFHEIHISLESFFKQKNEDAKKISVEIVSLQENSKVQIVAWEDSKIDGRVLRKFSKAQIFVCELPKFYFLFLDSLKPSPSPQVKHYFDQALTVFSSEQLFYSMVKRIKHLSLVKSGKTSEYPETKLYQTWQLQKLRNQASSWSEEELTFFLKQLFEIERKLKTSELPLSLSSHIDILLFSGVH